MMSDLQLTRRRFMQAAAGAAIVGAPAILPARPRTRSVIMLGIDGMDPGLVTRYVSEGRMPNTAKLMRAGTFSALRTANPAQSPVAWSNVISGTNPGGHGIFDFIARDPSTMVPFFSASRTVPAKHHVRVGKWRLPISASRTLNLRRGPVFWEELVRQGVDCTILQMPANYPPTGGGAKTLSGLGTPDIRGSYGIFSFYTDKSGERSRDVAGGRIEKVRNRKGLVECVLHGPANDMNNEVDTADIAFRVHVDPVSPLVRIGVQDTELILREGEWSDWVALRFPLLGHVADMQGICRFFLKSARDSFQLYVSPVNIAPSDPDAAISTPRKYAAELARTLGPFYTQGMPEDTSALSAGVLTDSEYRGQATFVLDEDMRLFRHELNSFDEGMFFFYFSSIDLNSHMFWRTLDPGHSGYSEELVREHGDFIPEIYAVMDTAIGEAMERMDDRTCLMVVSDHGFGSFRRQFHLNSWLMDNGYASPADPRTRGQASYLGDVEWSRTRAYGLGINGIYLNLRGREGGGIVSPGDEQTQLEDEIAGRLRALRDPVTGVNVIRNVFRAQEIYSGPFVAQAPDLVVGYNKNYRASWDTVLGRFPRGDAVSTNSDPWSGDHTFDASLVPGVFLCNRPLVAEDPGLEDLAPTVLSSFGCPTPGAMTGRAIV